MTLEEKLEKLADSQLVTNGMVARLEQKVEDLTGTVNGLAHTLANFMVGTDKAISKIDEAITKLAAAQLVTEEKLQALGENLQALGEKTNAMDEAITKLAAAQLVTEEKLQQFIASLKRGTNGQS